MFISGTNMFSQRSVLIETLWNVNSTIFFSASVRPLVLIETLWTVNTVPAAPTPPVYWY